jgi:hypothetical protein
MSELPRPRYEFAHFSDAAKAMHRHTREIFTYWQSLWRDGRPPSRLDIDPVEMRSYLPYVTMGDLESAPLRVRYRIYGTAHAEFNKRDLTGHYLDDFDCAAFDHIDWIGCFKYLYETKRPIIGDNSFKSWRGLSEPYEYCILPLFRDGDHAGGFLGFEALDMLDRRQIPDFGVITPRGDVETSAAQ